MSEVKSDEYGTYVEPVCPKCGASELVRYAIRRGRMSEKQRQALDPVAVEMVLAGTLATTIGFLTDEWATALRRAARAVVDAHENGMLDLEEE